ncbi:MAG: S8 family serine peptidase, partial [Clostridia bacterium]|nr:S8 family serine peptidase [Clostridia bacterium]
NLFSYDLSGHGTGVAGVIGAKNNDKGIIGIYENVELYSIQVLTPTGQAPLSRIVAGIDWAIENGVDVLNMSFGTNTNSEILYDAIVRADNSGMVLVAAAGNTENTTQYPAKYNEVISVGSVDGSGNISDFSAKDSFVDIYAPGESVQTTTIVSGYTANNGTSLAAPHVSAAAALIKATDSERTTADIKNLILATANKSVEGNEKGILDIENMLAHADNFDYTNNQTTYQNTEPFDDYYQETVVVGSWSPAAHQARTNEAYNNNISGWQQDEDINIKFSPEAEHIQLMAISSYLADSLYGSKVWCKVRVDSNGNPVFEKKKMLEFYPLHGHGNVEREVEDILEDEYAGVDEGEIKGININGTVTDVNSNYVADVKYLYRLARACMDYNLTDGELTVSQALDNIDDVTGLDANINDLRNIVRSESVLYTNRYDFYFGIDEDDNWGAIALENKNSKGINQGTPVYGIVNMDILENCDENNPTAFAFKILGLALHLVGDVYAHRTRVPYSSINDTSYFPENIEDLYVVYDFLMTHNTNKFNDITVEWYLRYKNNKSAICTCYDCFRNAISTGHVEFRDIPNFHENDDTLFFEPDNTDFYGQRYTVATKHATEKMILLLLTNKDFSIYAFAPEEAYTLKLNNLKQYIIDSGVNWGSLTQNHSALQARIIELSTGAEI